MSKDNRVSMPSGIGGLVRYFDEYKSKIEFKPGHILILAIVIILLVVALHTWGSSLIH